MKTKIYKKWSKLQYRRLLEFCLENKEKFKETILKNKNSFKKSFKPRYIFKEMAEYVKTKSQKQCKSKFQKKEIQIYKKLGILELFQDKTNQYEKNNCVEENKFQMYKEAPTITTFSIQSSALKPIDSKEQSQQVIQKFEPEEKSQVQKLEQLNLLLFNNEDNKFSDTKSIQSLSNQELMNSDSLSFLELDEQIIISIKNFVFLSLLYNESILDNILRYKKKGTKEIIIKLMLVQFRQVKKKLRTNSFKFFQQDDPYSYQIRQSELI